MARRYTRLTRPNIRALKPGEKITEHGITALREPDGDVRDSVNIMVDRQRIHRVVGLESDRVTRSQCEQFITKARTEAREERLSLPAGRFTVLSDEQADNPLRGAMQDEDTYCWLFVLIALNTAMRHSVILQSRFDNLDIENLRLFIPKAKAGQREQPITQELADTLKREREGRDGQDGWIFPAVRPKLSIKGHRTRMDRPFRRSVIRAGLDPATVTPHCLRHTAITNLVQSGADLATIQRISGHKTLEMVMRCTHVHGPHIDRTIKAIGRSLPEPSGNNTAGTVTQELHTVPKRPA